MSKEEKKAKPEKREELMSFDDIAKNRGILSQARGRIYITTIKQAFAIDGSADCTEEQFDSYCNKFGSL